MTSLTGAAQQGDVECLKELITAGADVNKKDKTGDTALFWAAYNRYTDHVKQQQQRVISQFSESSMADTKGVLDFLKASVEQASKQATLARHADYVKELLAAGADVNIKNNENYTTLIYGAKEGNVNIVKMMIAAGADVNTVNIHGSTPLAITAEDGHVDCLKEFLAAGAQINKQEKDGRTALHFACQKGHINCVKELIDAGTELGVTDHEGRTALMYAIFSGSFDCVTELIVAGVDVNIKNK